MARKVAGPAILLVIATLLAMGGSADAQEIRQQRIPRTQPGDASTEVLVRCFVPYCSKCNSFNPYLCAACNVGYQLTGAFSCNSCAPGYEQNLEERTFVCVQCAPGFTSDGGVGVDSQCYPITDTVARRLFGSDDELWA